MLGAVCVSVSQRHGAVCLSVSQCLTDGGLLLGPQSQDGHVEVGDHLTVRTIDGPEVTVECVGFPWINLGANRVDWARVCVQGVAPDEVQVGSLASRSVR